jgi:hypothetical protein
VSDRSKPTLYSITSSARISTVAGRLDAESWRIPKKEKAPRKQGRSHVSAILGGLGDRGIGEAVQLALDVGRFQSVSGEAASSDRDALFGQIHLDKIQHQRLVERVTETSRDDHRFEQRSAFEPC